MVQKFNYNWPEGFPEGVPVEEAVPASGMVYRLVENIPPTELDFQMYRKERPDIRIAKEKIPYSYGVSVWSKLSKILRQKERYPKPEQFGNKKVVGGELTEDLGLMYVCTVDKGHVTLWGQEGAKPHLQVCEEIT
jgi:dipeptidyl aminopeptidase/acylaminoacyl peptidase